MVDLRALATRRSALELAAIVLFLAIVARATGFVLPIFLVGAGVAIWRFGFEDDDSSTAPKDVGEIGAASKRRLTGKERRRQRAQPKEEQKGARSAWSVFNEDMERLPGTFGAEYIEASARGTGVARPSIGRDDAGQGEKPLDAHEIALMEVRAQVERERRASRR
jgi:Uncharacterized conserved domain (SAYSvFN)